MDAMSQPISFYQFAISAPRKRAFITSTRGMRLSSVILVVALHLAAFFAWMSLPPSAPVPEREMEVTVATVIAPVAQPEASPAPHPPEPLPAPQPRKIAPAPKPAPVESVAQPSETPLSEASPGEAPPSESIIEQPGPPAPVVAAETAIVATATTIVSSAPDIPDVEPDYKAGYLNNPRPPYPFAARRMGLQGKVVLNVEVLAEGLCGQANVHQSSGHEMLDNTALQTVKTWKFIPARQAGRAITKWFKIPIQFSLNNNET